MSTGNGYSRPDAYVPTAPSKKLYGAIGKTDDAIDMPERFEGLWKMQPMSSHVHLLLTSLFLDLSRSFWGQMRRRSKRR